MKYYENILNILLFLIINFKSIACDLENKNDSINKEMQIWLGDNSSFSKSYMDGKCALDKALKIFLLQREK